ncbi:type II secretion system F family protein [Paenibacillus sp. y28]|uniref:type II secretion system F family protein n=1 Tax=Paenibacillus sp. y28 TaxID=3129110 RepID=UPI00301871CC
MSNVSLEALAISLIERLQLPSRLTKTTDKLIQHMAFLHGLSEAEARMKQFYARQALFCFLVMGLGMLLALTPGGDPVMLPVLVLLSAIVPFLGYRSVLRRIMLAKRQIAMELPELLGNLVLLIGAGETVQKALLRCIRQLSGTKPGSILQRELAAADIQLRNQLPFSQVLEQLAARCGIQEVAMLTTTLLLNYKRGGEELTHALAALNRELWERRKAGVRTIGEEASSRMVFPMVLIFVVVLVIVAYPAIAVMG